MDITQIPQNRQKTNLEELYPAKEYKDGMPVYRINWEVVEALQEEILKRLIEYGHYHFEEKGGPRAITPIEIIKAVDPFLMKGYYPVIFEDNTCGVASDNKNNKSDLNIKQMRWYVIEEKDGERRKIITEEAGFRIKDRDRASGIRIIEAITGELGHIIRWKKISDNKGMLDVRIDSSSGYYSIKEEDGYIIQFGKYSIRHALESEPIFHCMTLTEAAFKLKEVIEKPKD